MYMHILILKCTPGSRPFPEVQAFIARYLLNISSWMFLDTLEYMCRNTTTDHNAKAKKHLLHVSHVSKHSPKH